MSWKRFILNNTRIPKKFVPGDVIHYLKLILTETLYLIFSNSFN